MSNKVFTTSPPSLYNALKAEGFILPDECGDVTLTMPVMGTIQLHYVVNLTEDDIVKMGRGLARLGAGEAIAGVPNPSIAVAWQPIETAPKDRAIIGALIRNGTVWRVHDMRHNGLAFYTIAGGSLPEMTHWADMPQG